jgi:hypothetical protein
MFYGAFEVQQYSCNNEGAYGNNLMLKELVCLQLVRRNAGVHHSSSVTSAAKPLQGN